MPHFSEENNIRANLDTSVVIVPPSPVMQLYASLTRYRIEVEMFI